MCKFFEVSRGGYYAFLKRMDIPDRDLPLAEKIKECQEETYRTYGYRRVHIWLERQGIQRNPKTILRVMQKYNLLSVVRRKKFHYCSQYLHRYPNLLNREFTAEKPNQKWVTDISYIKTVQGFLYLSIIRDLYDNSIVAYKTDKEQSIKLVLDTIKAAKRKEKITAEVQLHRHPIKFCVNNNPSSNNKTADCGVIRLSDLPRVNFSFLSAECYARLA